MRIEKYLDDVMNKHHFRKDKQLAEWLGVSAVSISSYRSGERSMDNDKCVKIAMELDIDPIKVIMASDLDKAERTGQKSMWEIFTQRMAATAASALVLAGVTLFLTPQNAEARTYSPASSQNSNSLYIM